MTAHHLAYRRLNRSAVTATRALLAARTGRLPVNEAMYHFRAWLVSTARIYDVPAPGLAISPAADAADSYDPRCWPGTIVMRQPGITALLRGFRRHLHSHGTPAGRRAPEQDAAAWSYSLLHSADPEALIRLSRQGKTPGLHPRDLEPAREN